jgi:hypothetical protein
MIGLIWLTLVNFDLNNHNLCASYQYDNLMISAYTIGLYNKSILGMLNYRDQNPR